LDKIGVELWQHDLWWQIAVAARSGNINRVNLKFSSGTGAASNQQVRGDHSQTPAVV
jgi:hypothetical protein